MRIALSMRIVQASGYEEPRDAISHDWLNKLKDWDMTPLLIPNVLADDAGYLAEIRPDILVLTGGNDLDATPMRDGTEAGLLKAALQTNVPVLGVCRGLQLINRYFGGRTSEVDGHVACSHTLQITEPWQGLYGPVIQVNSYHDQGIAADDLGADLLPAAVDEHGFVEAAFHPEQAVAGIMWHPERPDAPEGDRALVLKLATRGAFWK